MQLHVSESEPMPPKPGYKQPGREGKVSLLLWLDEEVRTALKLTAIERGTSVQAAFEEWATEFAAETLKRLRRKGAK